MNNKVKLKKSIILIAFILLIVIVVIVFLYKKYYLPNVGKIENGKIVYSSEIVNATKSKDNYAIEFENNIKELDNGIITKEMYDNIINNNTRYELLLEDYLKLNDVSPKDAYNINKAIELKLVKDNNTYLDYIVKICGFKNKNELIKYTKAVLKLMNELK